jgi:hypothetical protein
MTHIEGKGDDQPQNTPKTAFRCLHRWSKVSLGLVDLAPGVEIPKSKKRPNGWMLVTHCRRCGVLKASLVSIAKGEQRLALRHQIRYLKNAEGIHFTEFELPSQEEPWN